MKNNNKKYNIKKPLPDGWHAIEQLPLITEEIPGAQSR